MQMWAASSTSGDNKIARFDRCFTDTDDGARLPPYCDADGDGSTAVSYYGKAAADAVLVFAHAMHAIFEGGGSLDRLAGRCPQGDA